MPQVHKAGVLARLQRRMGLDVGSTDLLGVQYGIVPTTNADELLKRIEGREGSFSVSGSANQWDTTITVPPDERWHIRTINFYRNSGDNTIDAIAFASYVTGVFCVVAEFSATNSYSTFVETDVVMSGGDTIKLHTSGAGSSGSVFTGASWVEIESIF
jgi:hypothetical protein